MLGPRDPNVLGYLTPKRPQEASTSFLQVNSPRFASPSVVHQENNMDTPTSSLNLTPLTPTTIFQQHGYTPSPDRERNFYPWNWHEKTSSHEATPNTPVRRDRVSPERTFLVERLQTPSFVLATPERNDYMSPGASKDLQNSGKRGRPRADVVTSLIMEGNASSNAIKCHICSRVFPREKSLQAHLRTHTGERPYTCDYPSCSRAFTQSGQLKTHQRLHAGEKPFVCSGDGCNNRYTHANRTCPEHPYAKPKRTTEIFLQPIISASEDQDEVFGWLQKYRKEREEKTPGKQLGSILSENTPERYEDDSEATPNKVFKSKRVLVGEMEQSVGQENVPSPPRSSYRSDILRSTLTAQDVFSQALIKAGERLEQTNSFRVLNLQNQSSAEGSTPRFRSILETHLEHAPQRIRQENENVPRIRRTLGDITPTKNIKPDNMANQLQTPRGCKQETMTNHSEYGVNSPLLHLPTLPLGFPSVSVENIPQVSTTTPLHSSPNSRTPSKSSSPISPDLQGSPALKLKKRFQERFAEQKLMEKNTDDLARPILQTHRLLEKNTDDLARPIAWHEEDEHLNNASKDDFRELLGSPVHRRRNPSPKSWVVATALVELHDSPTRLLNPPSTHVPVEELPLNLTKHDNSNRHQDFQY